MTRVLHAFFHALGLITQVGTTTIENLHRQNEQVLDIHEELEGMDLNLARAEKLLK